MALGIKIPKGVFAAGKEKLAEFGDNVELPPARYTCILVKGRAVSMDKGPQIVFDLKVAGDSEYAGKKFAIFFALTEDRVVYLFRALTLLGYDVDNLDEAVLEEILNDIASNTPVVRVTSKHTGEYTNYRIDKLLPELSAADATAGATGEETENAADTQAAGGKAGVKPGAHAKAGQAAAAKEADPPPAKAKAPLKKTPQEPQPEPDPEPEAEAEEVAEGEEAEVELAVGMKVGCTIKEVDHKAIVREIGEDGKVLIESTTDKKKYRISLDRLTLIS